jgi:hypothetical protein
MNMIVEECSKDGNVWIKFSEYPQVTDGFIMFGQEYTLAKAAAISEGYIYWRIRIESLNSQITSKV